MKIKVSNVNTPNWKEVTVKSRIPEELEKLSEIARNIWWAWNFEATELFRDLDPELWKECGQNPVLLLERMSYEKLEALAKDKVILRRMNEVYTKFRDYMDVKPDEQRPSIAYFSMEYGLSSVLKIYSGGLGVLAGDYLKEASDSNVDLCAVGFLYRYGYFTQTLSMDGQQIANYEAQNFVADSLIGFNALRNSIEDFDSEEALPHPYQWNNFSPEEVANHDENAARNVLRRMHHVNDITPRDFVEVCVDMKQQGVGGYDSWGARPEPFHQIPANRDYQWGFTLVPVRSANQANEAAKYDYR